MTASNAVPAPRKGPMMLPKLVTPGMASGLWNGAKE